MPRLKNPRQPHDPQESQHRSRVCHFVIDCDDLDRAVAFWAAARDAAEEPLAEESSKVYRRLRLPDSEIWVLLQRTDDMKGSKERMHLDLETDDVEAEFSGSKLSTRPAERLRSAMAAAQLDIERVASALAALEADPESCALGNSVSDIEGGHAAGISSRLRQQAGKARTACQSRSGCRDHHDGRSRHRALGEHCRALMPSPDRA